MRKSNVLFYTTALLLFLSALSALQAGEATVTVDAGTAVYTIPDSLYSCNLASWCWNEDGKDLLKNEFLQSTGRTLYRWPGGSWGDAYIWDTIGLGDNSWAISYAECLNFLDKIGGTMQPIVNCGGVWDGEEHTNAEAVAKAAAWVTDMNIDRNLGVKYWEIGNEMHGSWEEGYCATGTEYAQRYCNFYRAMKAVDPTIQCGADACETETDYNNWMATMLTEMDAQGIIPDFFIIHVYPTINREVTPENDAICLAAVDDIAVITANLDAMVEKYFGASYVGQIGYALTEFSAAPADHLYVDAMYNSQVMLECAKNKWIITNPWMEDIWYRYGYVTPTFYMFPFLQYKFGRQLVTASSSNTTVRSYAAKDNAGNLTLFMVNNSPTESMTANVAVSGFTPGATGEQWLLEPVHTGLDPQIPASAQIQEADDMRINGVVHPDPRLLDEQVLSEFIQTGSAFSVTLPASGMVFLRLFPSGRSPAPHPVVSPPTPTPAPLTASGPVKLQYKCMETGSIVSSSRFSLNVINTSSQELPLSDLVIRYWYTREGPWGWEDIACDWAAGIPAESVQARFFNIFGYWDMTIGGDPLPPGGETGEIQLRFFYGDYSEMDQSNDYSFSPSTTEFTDYTKICLYRDGVLVWGAEPEGLRPPPVLGATPVPTPVPPPSTPPTTPPTTNPGLSGDVNGSGQVDIVDALQIAQYYVGLEPAGFQAGLADVNCDGSITIVDALVVAQYYVGLITAFC